MWILAFDELLKLAICLFFVFVNTSVGIQILSTSLGVKVLKSEFDFRWWYSSLESIHSTVTLSFKVISDRISSIFNTLMISIDMNNGIFPPYSKRIIVVIKTLQKVCISWYDLRLLTPTKKILKSHSTQLGFELQSDLH